MMKPKFLAKRIQANITDPRPWLFLNRNYQDHNIMVESEFADNHVGISVFINSTELLTCITAIMQFRRYLIMTCFTFS